MEQEIIVNLRTDLPVLRFSYINHKGTRAIRNVTSPSLFWGNTDYYPEDQWLLYAYDLDKKAWRTFALNAVTLQDKQDAKS